MAYNELAYDYNPSYRIGFYGVDEVTKEKIEEFLGETFFTFYDGDGLVNDDLLDLPDLIISGENIDIEKLTDILTASRASLIKVASKSKEELNSSGVFAINDDEEFMLMIETTINTAVFTNALKIRDMLEGMDLNDKISTLLLLMQKKDPYTVRHSQNVSQYAEMMSKELGLSDERTERIKLGGLLHDIGKICLTDSILFNTTPKLAEDKMKIMQVHTSLGTILLPDELESLKDMVALHHERLDGSGYPYGLSAEDLLDDVRIISVADTYDAMTTERSYQKAMSEDEAMAVLDKLADTSKPKLDIRIVRALKEALRKEKQASLIVEGRSR